MPADPSILGFANRWQAAALPHAIERRLPSAAVISAVSPPYLLATMLEAFKGRGRHDFLGSRDFGDVIAVVDGREGIVDEVAGTDAEARTYIADELERLLSHHDSSTDCSAHCGRMRPARLARKRSLSRNCGR